MIRLSGVRALASLLCLGISMIVLGGCLSKSKVTPYPVQIHMSQGIFLDPLAPDQKSVFLQVPQGSNQSEWDLQAALAQLLQAKGYRIVHQLAQADYWLQAHVLVAGVCDPKALEAALQQGFAKPLDGGLVCTLGDPKVPDRVAAILADVQISQRTGRSVALTQKTGRSVKASAAGTHALLRTEKIHWQRYQTRMLGTVTTATLKFQKLQALLLQALNQSIVGFF